MGAKKTLLNSLELRFRDPINGNAEKNEKDNGGYVGVTSLIDIIIGGIVLMTLNDVTFRVSKAGDLYFVVPTRVRQWNGREYRSPAWKLPNLEMHELFITECLKHDVISARLEFVRSFQDPAQTAIAVTERDAKRDAKAKLAEVEAASVAATK